MDTRQVLIDTALKAFLEKGYSNVSLNEVALTVNIKKPSIYYHFKDKEALFEACAEEFYKRWQTWLANDLQQAESLEDLIQAMCFSLGTDAVLIKELYGAETIVGQYQFVLDSTLRFPHVLKHMQISNQAFLSLLEEKLAEAQAAGKVKETVTAEFLYTSLSCLLEGSNILHFTDPQLEVSKYSQQIYEMIWNSIRTMD